MPAKAADLPLAFQAYWGLPRKVGMPTVAAPISLAEQEKRFAESIEYINNISKTKLNKKSLNQVVAQAIATVVSIKYKTGVHGARRSL